MQLGVLKLIIEKLRVHLARRNRADFASTSERFEGLQTSLLETQPLNELSTRRAAAKPAANTPHVDRNLPRACRAKTMCIAPAPATHATMTTGISCGCYACSGRMRLIGRDVSEQLEYVPVRFKVIRHVRPKLACTNCEVIFQVGALCRPIAKGLAGAGQLAYRASEPDHGLEEAAGGASAGAFRRGAAKSQLVPVDPKELHAKIGQQALDRSF